MRKTYARYVILVLAAILLLSTVGSSIVFSQEGSGGLIATPVVGADGTSIEWQPEVEYGQLALTLSGPDEFVHRQVFAAGEVPEFSLSSTEFAQKVVNGQYSYEIRALPVIASETLEALEMAEPEQRAEMVHQFQRSGQLPETSPVQFGTFQVVEGQIIKDNATEEDAEEANQAPDDTAAPDDYVVNDDLIVTLSACIGFDCVNGESFGFQTLILKENNTRFMFMDTSSSGSFPNNDWMLQANESTNGGANQFAIFDCGASGSTGSNCGGTRVFAVEAGAGANAIYVDQGGEVGFGTSTPVVELHSADGDTPTLRLEQTGSSGFTPQTWDVAGNEANFFVRDVTNGSRLPFRIRPGAPTSSIDVAANGNMGVGTSSPSASLDVHRADGSAQLLVRETSGTVAKRFLMTLENNGAPGFQYTNTSSGESWQFAMSGTDNFVVSRVGTGGPELSVYTSGAVTMGPGGTTTFNLDSSGNLVIAGTLTESSSREVKENLAPVDSRGVLEQLNNLPIYHFNYRSDDTAIRHVGPVAEEFYAAFELGADDKHLSPRNLASLAVAAIQELSQQLNDKDAQIQELEAELQTQQQQIEALQRQNALLEARLAHLEEMVRTPPEKQK